MKSGTFETNENTVGERSNKINCTTENHKGILSKGFFLLLAKIKLTLRTRKTH
jgi:hypothetical protein